MSIVLCGGGQGGRSPRVPGSLVRGMWHRGAPGVQLIASGDDNRSHVQTVQSDSCAFSHPVGFQNLEE